MESTGYSDQIVIKLEFSRQILEKYSNIKFRENPSSGNRVFLCGQTERQTDMTKLIVAFRNFTNATKNAYRFWLGRGTESGKRGRHKHIRVQGNDFYNIA